MSEVRSAAPYVIFFFNDTATTEIYTLSLHDALPISNPSRVWALIEAEDGGVYRSDDAGATWKRTNNERRLRQRSEEHTSELQSPDHLVCRLLLEKKNN